MTSGRQSHIRGAQTTAPARLPRVGSRRPASCERAGSSDGAKVAIRGLGLLRARKWTRERVIAAMQEWSTRYSELPSSYDWSRTPARRRGGEALRRLRWRLAAAGHGDRPVRNLAGGESGRHLRRLSRQRPWGRPDFMRCALHVGKDASELAAFEPSEYDRCLGLRDQCDASPPDLPVGSAARAPSRPEEASRWLSPRAIRAPRVRLERPVDEGQANAKVAK